MEDLYPIAVSFRFFVPNCGFSHEFGLNSSLEMLARSKQRERDENNKRSSSSFSQRRMMRLCVCILCARYNIIMANENDQFFKVKIYSGTDNFQTTSRQLERYIYISFCTRANTRNNKKRRLWDVNERRRRRSAETTTSVILSLQCFWLPLLLVVIITSLRMEDNEHNYCRN